MAILCTSTAVSTAPPEAIFARWADMESWPEWDEALAWIRLDGPFVAGMTGELKPRRGPKSTFIVESLEPGFGFTTVSAVPGGRLRIRHLTGVRTDGRTDVTVEVSIDGTLARMWALILRRSISRSTPPGVARLVAVAERDPSGG